MSVDNIRLFSELVEGKYPENSLYKVVLLPDVIKKDGVLNVSSYIKQESTWTAPNVEQEMKRLQKCEADFEAAQGKLTKLLSS